MCTILIIFNVFLEILFKFKLAFYYLINTCLKIATSRSCFTSRNFWIQMLSNNFREENFLPTYNFALNFSGPSTSTRYESTKFSDSRLSLSPQFYRTHYFFFFRPSFGLQIYFRPKSYVDTKNFFYPKFWLT